MYSNWKENIHSGIVQCRKVTLLSLVKHNLSWESEYLLPKGTDLYFSINKFGFFSDFMCEPIYHDIKYSVHEKAVNCFLWLAGRDIGILYQMSVWFYFVWDGRIWVIYNKKLSRIVDKNAIVWKSF